MRCSSCYGTIFLKLWDRAVAVNHCYFQHSPWCRQLMAVLSQDVNMDRMRCYGRVHAPWQPGKCLKEGEAPRVLPLVQAEIGICQQEARGLKMEGVWHSQAGLMSPGTDRSTTLCKQGVLTRIWYLQVHPPMTWCPSGTLLSPHCQKSSECRS